MAKKVFYDEDARRRVLGGASLLYNAVKTTMGPKGRNVVIGKSYGGPSVTHDGVTVAKGVDIADVDDETLGYSVGAELIKEAANKMNDVAGDGTTTVTVLTYHILEEANKLIAAGHNPMALRRGLEKAAEEVLNKLDGMSEDITGKKAKIAEVATISAGDKEIGSLIADVMEKVGKDGIVTVEEGRSLDLESEVVEGFTTDRGYLSPFMATDTNRMNAVLKNPAIFITDMKLTTVDEIQPVLELVANSGKKELLIVAEDIEGDALTMLVLNKLKAGFNAVAIKAPSFGDRKKDILRDMAILTGASVVSEELGANLTSLPADVLGGARKVITTKDTTTIVEGAGSAKDVAVLVEQITEQISSTTSAYDKGELEKRRAAIQGKVAVIKVGGASETEIEEKKYRVDDAVAAVKAALSEGVVPGGGVTLVNLAKTITSLDDSTEDAGAQLLARALEKPFRTLLENSGLNADEWLPKVKEAKVGMGVDVNNPSKLVDLKKAGVIDPVLVTRQAVQYSSSIAGTSMTMGALVVDVPQKDDSSAGNPSMGGMGMM